MRALLAALCLLVAGSACRPTEALPSPQFLNATPKDEAQLSAAQATGLWTLRCASCHGELGRGDTPFGQMMRAPDMTLPVWQRGINDDLVRVAIRRGVHRTTDGFQSDMPANVDLSPAQLDSLVALVRRKAGG